MPNRRSTLSPARLEVRGHLDEAGTALTPHPPTQTPRARSRRPAQRPRPATRNAPEPAGSPLRWSSTRSPGAPLPHSALRRRRAAAASYLLLAVRAEPSEPAGMQSPRSAAPRVPAPVPTGWPRPAGGARRGPGGRGPGWAGPSARGP